MPTVRYGAPLNVLVAARGHPYARDAFMSLFDEMDGVSCALVEQPAAARLMTREGMRGFDVLALYDMPGIDFRAPGGLRYVEPDPEFKSGFLDLLDEGRIGIVALHHAIAGWPAWPRYAELLGGRFLYRAGDGVPDSGYRHDVTHEVRLEQPDHPISAGLPGRFTFTDELYLFELFAERVRPLLRSDHKFGSDGFYSAAMAVAGRMHSNEGWTHPPGPDLVGWIKRAGACPLAYLQPGDGPATYADPNYRRLVENAVRWAASAEARAEALTLPG